MNNYDNYFRHYFKDVNQLDDFKKSDRYYRHNYLKLLPENKNANIVDLGCGLGQFVHFLIKQGYNNVVGIDASDDNISFARKEERQSTRFYAMDAFAFLEKNFNKFDLIIANDFLEHIPKSQVPRMIDLIYLNLREGGAAIIKVPNMSNPFSLMNRYKDFTHETGFTETSLKYVFSPFKLALVKGASYPVYSLSTALGKTVENFLYLALKVLFKAQGHSCPQYLEKAIIIKAIK